jgi:hypothetical protein
MPVLDYGEQEPAMADEQDEIHKPYTTTQFIAAKVVIIINPKMGKST